MKLNVGEQNLPMTYSVLNKPSKGAVLSAFKKAEDEDALIVRMYNPSESDTITDKVEWCSSLSEWIEVGLDEVALNEWDKGSVQAGSIGGLAPCQVKTFKVELALSNDES